MLFAVSLPGLLFGPFAMAYLDRWQRRSVMMVSDAFRAFVVVVIAAWLLPLCHGTRRRAASPSCVHDDLCDRCHHHVLLSRAHRAGPESRGHRNAGVCEYFVLQASLAVATVGGRALGGFVANAWCGVGSDGKRLAYIGSVGIIWGLRVEPPASVASRHEIGWSELKTGLVYLLEHRMAVALVAFVGGVAFLLAVLRAGDLSVYAMNTLKLGTGGSVIRRCRRRGRGARDRCVRAGQTVDARELVAVRAIDRGWDRIGADESMQQRVAVVPLVVVLGAVAATVMISHRRPSCRSSRGKRRGAVFAARGMFDISNQ